MTWYSRIKIIQNINGFYVSGEYFPDEQMNDPSSGFISYNEEIKRQVDGSFQLYYFFRLLHQLQNKPNLICWGIFVETMQEVADEFKAMGGSAYAYAANISAQLCCIYIIIS